MYITVMRRPPRTTRKVEAVAEIAEEPQDNAYTRCAGCVTRKMCDDVEKCLHGKKAKRKKANGRRNGRVSTQKHS